MKEPSVVDVERKVEMETESEMEKTKTKTFIFTHDFEAAASRCKAKVEFIAAHCRSQNRRYRDVDFDLDFDRDKALHSVDRYTYFQPSSCLRVHQIFEKPVFFASKDGPSSEVLGWGSNDGTFLGALGTAATGGYLERICVARDESVGVYGFIFWGCDGWKEVIVDDLLFICIPRWEELNRRSQAIWQDNSDNYRKNARKGGRSLFFARSMNENETWVALLEKAYAKLIGDYASIYRRPASQVVENLTGAIASNMAMGDILDTDELWEKRLLPVGKDRLAAVFIEGSPANQYNSDKGLVDEEPFYVTKALEIAGRRFLIMRNPWGHKINEWTGKWGTGSSEWTPEWLQRVVSGEFEPFQFGQEGRFIMEYCDFLEIWDYLASFQLFDSSWALSQLWLQVDLGAYPRAPDYGDVSYTIHISEPTRAVISLQSQYVDDNSEGLSRPFIHKIDFVIFRAGECDPLYFSQKNDAASHYGVAVEVDLLEAGEYILHPRIDRERRFLNPPASITPPASVSAPAPIPVGPSPLPPAIFPISRPSSPKPPKPKPVVVGRKFSHAQSAMLQCNAVAANFDVLRAETETKYMPLPSGTFGGEDLTTMEFRIFEKLLKYKSEKKDAWESKRKEKLVDKSEETQEPGSCASTVVGSTPVGVQEDDDGSDNESFVDASESIEMFEPPSPQMPGQLLFPESRNESNTSPDIMFLPDFEIDYAFEDATTLPISDLTPRVMALDLDHVRRSPVASLRSPSPPVSPKLLHCPMSPPEMVVPIPPSPPGSPPGPPLHEGFACRGCSGPVYGSRYKCMSSVTCPFYDLCSKCYEIGAHEKGHRFLEIPTPQDAALLFNNDEDFLPGNEVILGLRIYTDKSVEAKIEGQLRHGDLIRRGLRRHLVI